MTRGRDGALDAYAVRLAPPLNVPDVKYVT